MTMTVQENLPKVGTGTIVLTVFGFVLPLLSFIAILTGSLALKKINKNEARGNKSLIFAMVVVAAIWSALQLFGALVTYGTAY